MDRVHLKGDPPFAVRVHWLRLTVGLGLPEHSGGRSTSVPMLPVLGVLADALGVSSDEFVSLGHGGWGYKDILWCESVQGVKVYRYPSSGSRLTIDLGGEACDRLGADLRVLVDGIAAAEGVVGLSCSRVDVAFDHLPFTPKDLEDAHSAGILRTTAGTRWLRSDTGDTFYIGKRGGRGWLTRCYNRRGFTRLEFELADEYAGVAFAAYRAAGDRGAAQVAAALASDRVLVGSQAPVIAGAFAALTEWAQSMPAPVFKEAPGGLTGEAGRRALLEAREQFVNVAARLFVLVEGLGIPEGALIAQLDGFRLSQVDRPDTSIGKAIARLRRLRAQFG